MSGSISESDACGNDWDETWIPPTVTGVGTTLKSHLNFTWKVPWRKVDVILINHDGQSESVSDETGCFQPIKFQFILNNRLDKLQSSICKIQTLDVKSLMSGTELLEITTKSDVHPGSSTEIATVLLNEMEDVFLKMIPRLPYTCKLAEDSFSKHIQEGKMTMVRDDTKVFIVCPSNWKELICHTIDKFNSLISTEVISFQHKWKRVVLNKLNAVFTVSKKHADVSVKTDDDFRKVVFQGRKDDVQKAVRELENIFSNLCYEKIIFDPIILQLLLCPEASELLNSILEKKGMEVFWTVEDGQLCLISQQKITKTELRVLMSENFIYAGFSYLSRTNQVPFTKSKIFIDAVKKYRDTLLVMECGNYGCSVASTRTIIQWLLEQECLYCDTSSRKVQGVLTGNQPYGTMTVQKRWESLEGYRQCGRIEICYHIPAGKQGPEHKTPGRYYDKITRTGYLPDNEKGQLVAKLLRVAFDRKLVFTIGESRTTGKTGVVTWNDIHHKTNPKPYAEFGYPDPTYLDRVIDELSIKGVTKDDIQPGTLIY